MSPLVAYHATPVRHREGIYRHGLLCSQPVRNRPFGVYVYRNDSEFDHPTLNSHTVWGCGGKLDEWEVSYIGPVTSDIYVANALIFLRAVPRECVSLV